jgi:hypothetical protein
MLDDRLELLRKQATLTGIDFVAVDPATQTTLDVHFYLPLKPALTDPAKVTIHSLTGAADVPPVAVIGAAMPHPDVLRLTTAAPGGFAPYVLRVDHPNVDPYFNGVQFSFKASCDAGLDCRKTDPECPPAELVDFPVDYLARDFRSFRRALLDFAAHRYPRWQDRLEADAGVMIAELLSALGDELAYAQDRIAREAYLESATQRRSLRRHARLVDYTMHDGLGATTWLDVKVAQDPAALTAGDRVWAMQDGRKVVFEVGAGFADLFPGPAASPQPVKFPVIAALNSLRAYVWDPGATCLEPGATQVDVVWPSAFAGPSLKAVVKSNAPPPGESWSRWVVLATTPKAGDAVTPSRALLVRLLDAVDLVDPLTSQKLTRLSWDAAQATRVELDLTLLEVRANLVPATAGETRGNWRDGKPQPDGDPALYFTIGPPADAVLPGAAAALERDGPLQESQEPPRRATTYLYSLPGSEANDVVWRGADPHAALPEVRLVELRSATPHLPALAWDFQRAFVGTPSSGATSTHFTLDDGTWRRLAGFRRGGQELVHVDYASDAGKTVRFGDGEFGQEPALGTPFRVYFRAGNGVQGNLPVGALINFDRAAIANVSAITNPLPISDGLDPETAEEVRLLAPEAFRAVTYRAVREEDYAEAAQRLAWVQRAGAAFRWTGSWLTAFVTPDPHDEVTLSAAHRRELEEQLDRFRQAGRPAFAFDPIYADLDLDITVCVEPSSYPGQVVERVVAALVGGDGAFFAPDNFTFGSPLERSLLEARVQAVPGVRAVEGIAVRRRGVFDRRPLELTFFVASNEVVRVMNDPLHPSRGSIRIVPKGGA